MPLTHIILPYKEVMTEKNAGAVATVVAHHVKLSSGDQNFQVFGQIVNNPTIPGIDYVPMKPSFSWVRGRNIGLARAYVPKAKYHAKTRPCRGAWPCSSRPLCLPETP